MKYKFIPDHVIANLECDSKEHAIHQLCTILRNENFISDKYVDKVIAREKEYPTGLQTRGPAIAIPHAYDSTIRGNHIVVGVLKDSVLFQNMEDLDEVIQVRIIFMLAISDAKKQLETLKMLMDIFQKQELLEEILNLQNSEMICNCLNNYIDGKEEN